MDDLGDRETSLKKVCSKTLEHEAEQNFNVVKLNGSSFSCLADDLG